MPAEPDIRANLALSEPDLPTVAVAFSGGRDSLALLHATCRAAQPLGLTVVALHVHHGLQTLADDWLRQARRLCSRWARRGWPLRLRVCRLTGQPTPGQSIEAWARQGRHDALARLAAEEGASLLLLAHHRQDQAETVLLQALRGAGTAGLSAMPRQQSRAGVVWARPWLDQPRRAVDAYIARHRLRPVEDPSNDDLRLARNRLRHTVWPALAQAFGDAEVALAAAARRAQQADEALWELAMIDLAPLLVADAAAGAGQALATGAAAMPGLRIDGWLALSEARRANVLWAWLRQMPQGTAGQHLVQRLLAELPQARAARWPAGGGSAVLVLHRGCLRWLDGVAAMPGDGQRALAPGPAGEWPCLDLSRPGLYRAAGWPGDLLVTAGSRGGLAPDRLRDVQLRARTGGERLALAPHAIARSLKKQYQQLAVPAHQRLGPLVFDRAGQLLWVSGLGVDARHRAPEGVPQCLLQWRPTAAGGAQS